MAIECKETDPDEDDSAGTSVREKLEKELNLGNLTRSEKIKDYIMLFFLTFLLTRYLTPTAIFVMFFSVFGFHLIQNLTYHEEPRPGFNALHIKYFLGTYLLCILYLQALRLYRGGDLDVVRAARLRTSRHVKPESSDRPLSGASQKAEEDDKDRLTGTEINTVPSPATGTASTGGGTQGPPQEGTV